MQLRTLGRTNLKVSEIGYGAWGIGKSDWKGANDADSLRALRRSIELGLNFIDTALGYGDGHSEMLVGQVVREVKDRVYVATKVPPKNQTWPAPAGIPVEDAFPGEYILQCVEQSLKNLNMEAIDVLQFHVWSDEWVHQGDWLETIEKLKKQGKIRFFGVSINDYQPTNALKLIESGVVDTVQVIYNVFEQSPEDELLPACQKHNIGVIVRVPLDEGGLTGKIRPDTTFPAGDFRADYFKGDRLEQVYRRVEQMASTLEVPIDGIAEAALRYVLSHSAVSTVIPGMRSIRNVERNCAIGDGLGLPRDLVEKLKAFRWVRDFYN